METARVEWVGSEQFLALTPSGHAVPFDSDRQSNARPGPMEMLLAALGACTATDVVVILAKKRQRLESLEVLVSGERAAGPPRVWTRLEIVYKLRGQLDEKAVRDAIELSETKYCSVAAMLRQAASISFRYEILPSNPA
ncbi:MAG TPA: OsmC family protein [Candidatus Acidoferrales bacterium]|nr:OsmC family protein [Candidatus Acidoferrales bacterium]